MAKITIEFNGRTVELDSEDDEIIRYEGGTCCVIGSDGSVAGEVFIVARVRIGYDVERDRAVADLVARAR